MSHLKTALRSTEMPSYDSFKNDILNAMKEATGSDSQEVETTQKYLNQMDDLFRQFEQEMNLMVSDFFESGYEAFSGTDDVEIFKVAKDVIIEDSVETMRKAIMVLTATTIAKEAEKNNEADTPEAEI